MLFAFDSTTEHGIKSLGWFVRLQKNACFGSARHFLRRHHSPLPICYAFKCQGQKNLWQKFIAVNTRLPSTPILGCSQIMSTCSYIIHYTSSKSSNFIANQNNLGPIQILNVLLISNRCPSQENSGLVWPKKKNRRNSAPNFIQNVVIRIYYTRVRRK